MMKQWFLLYLGLIYWVNLNIDDETMVSVIPSLDILGKPQY